MFEDRFTLKIGDTTVKGRRLTLRELKSNYGDAVNGKLSEEMCVEMIRGHVTLEDGDPVDPLDLTPDQLRRLVGELILPEKGRGIADFIGLLS